MLPQTKNGRKFKSLIPRGKEAFTLMEIGVVVLIIGILAAIVIPIYTTAVDKSRFTNLMPSVKDIVNAEREYQYGSGAYTNNFQNLNISLGDGQSASQDTVSLLNGTIQFKVVIEGDFIYVSGTDSRIKNVYKQYLPDSPQFPGSRQCEAPQNDERANNLCLSLNGTEIGTNGVNAVYALD
ncbi:MAG: hypothetical protein LBI01_01040, partial [Elusimicrobium sp.]|nr:hypothetical protein [Elusimicrobium sp.]